LRNVPAIETAVLQGIVAEHLTHVNAAEWVTTLLQRMRAVCRIDFNGFEPPGVGTGFLVRRDLVLTAYHVVERLISRAGSIDAALFAETAFCRFEYLNDGDRAGTVVKFMRPQWRMASSPPGGIEKIVGGAEPGENELDFALIRLDRDVEAEPFAFATTGAVEPDPLIVLQHPRRAPLRVAFGQMTAFNPNGTRLRHNAGTEAGSSGAPCLNQTLEVVGLHNATRYLPHGVLADYNTAVPILRIEQALLAKNIHIGPVVHT
jgi:S1-C subfamily serine protease